MESVLLVAPREYGDAFKARLEGLKDLSVSGATAFVVTDARSRVYVSHNEYVSQELEPEELERFKTMFGNPVFYTVDFSDIHLCRRVLFALADDPALWVDNDHGTLLSGPDFLDLLRRRPDWDWRRKPG
ncbi:MAG: hypothetical protein U0441_14170 [Polyangiaceae bacterium]